MKQMTEAQLRELLSDAYQRGYEQHAEDALSIDTPDEHGNMSVHIEQLMESV